MKRARLPRVRLPRAPWKRPRRAGQPAPLDLGRPADVGQADPGKVLRALRAAALWAIGALIAAASAASFSESYRGLFLWAIHHGLAGFWAAAFPPELDVFIGVGELSLFVAMVDQWKRRDRAAAWAVSLLGLAASVAGNVGHIVAGDLASRATAAVPPLAAFAALWVGLGTLKRVVGRSAPAAAGPAAAEVEQAEAPDAAKETVSNINSFAAEVEQAEVPTDAEGAAVIALRATVRAGNPLSGRQLEARFGLTRAQASKVRQAVLGPPNVPAIEQRADDTERETVNAVR